MLSPMIQISSNRKSFEDTELIPCDIGFTRSKHPISGIIRLATQSPGEEKTVASHVFMVTRPGIGYKATVMEAIFPKTTERTLEQGYYDSDADLCIFRPINLSRLQKHNILAESYLYENRPYGYVKLVLHLFDRIIGNKYLFRRLAVSEWLPICSYNVDAWYRAAGLDFGIPTKAITPDDIWDFCVANPDKYEFVCQRGAMYNGGSLCRACNRINHK